ncbi:MAG: hypothetical protein K8T20_20790 [Planctomycetes bacterium]|nr:hypothetical protein [Planctomycetota bacterium]
MPPPPAERFPVLRWFGMAFLVVLVPCYWRVWGGPNFMQLCDVALFLTVLGWWTGSSLLLSSQLLACLVIDLLWGIDAGGRVLTGRFIIGGGLTEYMWMPEYSLFVRLLSLFHVFWPILLLASIRKTGYDRRALAFQAAVALVVLTFTVLVAPHVAPGRNINFAFREPFRQTTVHSTPVHMLLTWFMTVACLYVPAHVLLLLVYRAPSKPTPSEGAVGTAVA